MKLVGWEGVDIRELDTVNMAEGCGIWCGSSVEPWQQGWAARRGQAAAPMTAQHSSAFPCQKAALRKEPLAKRVGASQSARAGCPIPAAAHPTQEKESRSPCSLTHSHRLLLFAAVIVTCSQNRPWLDAPQAPVIGSWARTASPIRHGLTACS